MATLGEYLGAGSDTTKLLLHLNGNSTDSSGNGNNGTDTAITYSQANGKFGQGAGFNGSSSKISLPTTGIPSGNDARTLSVWFRKTTTSVDVVYGLFSQTDNNGFGLYVNNTDVYIWLYGTADYDSTINISLNTWTNIILTHDGTTLKSYKDGNLVDSRAKTLATNTTNHLIGSNVASNYYNGSIDEVIIENRAWSASEIKKYYTYAKGQFSLN